MRTCSSFRKILDLGRLEKLVQRVEGHDYRLRVAGPGSQWTAGGEVSKSGTLIDGKGFMKVACAYDAHVLELLGSGVLRDPVPERNFKKRRYACVVHLRERATGWEFTVVGVHLKSNLPQTIDDARRDELALLADWNGGTANPGYGQFPQPPTADVVIAGDCNLLGELAVKEWAGGPLAKWGVPKHKVCTAIAAKSPKVLKTPAEQWSTLTDRGIIGHGYSNAFIDHFFVSPSAKKKAKGAALVFAFDRDPDFDQIPPASEHWMWRITNFKAIPSGYVDVEPVENLYRISDHRPVRLTFKTT